MKNQAKKIGPKNLQAGQGMIEYILVFVAVVVVLVATLSPGGLLIGQIDLSLDQAVTGIDCMVCETCYDPDGCTGCPAGCS